MLEPADDLAYVRTHMYVYIQQTTVHTYIRYKYK